MITYRRGEVFVDVNVDADHVGEFEIILLTAASAHHWRRGRSRAGNRQALGADLQSVSHVPSP